VLARFVEVSGGAEADIVVIPTASRLNETGPRYEKLFSELGAARVSVMDFDTRRDCQEAGRLQRLEEASGIFFTGGNQLRLTTLLGGTPIATMIRRRNAAGVTVGGTSAGASILSEHMIAFGDEGSSVISGSVRLAPGLGLTNRFVIDQHFRQRDRLGRLITALAYNPFAVGIGLDEDTAVFIGPDETLEVEGSGGVTIVDAKDTTFSSMDSVSPPPIICDPRSNRASSDERLLQRASPRNANPQSLGLCGPLAVRALSRHPAGAGPR
jgi:cyanophycinase